jgi:nitroreductase
MEMDVYEAIHNRKSIRAYAETPVPKETLERILEAGRVAPSAANRQPWHFIVVTDSEKRKVISKGPFAKFVTESPVVIVGCGDTRASPKWYMVDVSIALENIVLAATCEGLGTCWIGGFVEEEVKRLLEIPENFKIVALLSVGYPREKLDIGRTILKVVHKRKSLQEIVSQEKYGQAYK